MINSPFSRFNLGSLEPAGLFRSSGMGGTGIALRDNSSIYYLNPASYSSFDTTSFIFDFGIDYGINILTAGTDRHHSEDPNFDHMLMGFPIARGFGVATGIIPFSNGYYDIYETINESAEDQYTAYHSGEGGVSGFFLGTGISFLKNLSAGINMTLLFGNLERKNEFVFNDFFNYIHNTNFEKLRINGINLDFGLQYTINIKDDLFLTAGASMSSGKHYKSRWETLSIRYNAYSQNDTISYNIDNSTKAFLPGTTRYGLSFGKKDKFSIGVDLVSTKWSKAKIPGAEGYLADTRALSMGAEYIPEKLSNYNLARRMEYRIGMHVEDNYLILDGTQIKEYGASIGLGLPLPRSLSKANFFVDYTRKYGAGSDQIHNESIISLGASLNFYDWWFIKRRYN